MASVISLRDTRSKECLVSAILVLALSGCLLVLASWFDLASKRLLMLGCINIIAALGLGLFSGMTGILSLGHIVFFGVGAYVSAWFTLPSAMKPILLPKLPAFILETQWPLYWAIIPAILAALLTGLLTGLVMKRLRETSAVIASFGFLIIGYLLFIGLKPLTNGKQSIYGLPLRELNWPLVITALVFVVGFAFWVKSSRLGRMGEAFREDEGAARAIGIETDKTVFWLWVLSAGVMGLGGALFAHAIGVIAPSAFYLDRTFALLVIVIVGGYRSLTGCAVGAIIITIIEELLKHTESSLSALSGQTIAGLFTMPQVFGFTAICFSLIILLVFYLRPDGIVGYREMATFGWAKRLFGCWVYQQPENTKKPAYQVNTDAELKTTDLGKSYGAFRAMSNVNLSVKAGEIVGLIGPNGAGKSTFINTITGALFATEGKILLQNEEATLWSSVKLARDGLGRTFQNIRVFSALSVLENIIAAVNVKHPELSRPEAEAIARGWAQRLSLENFAHEQAENLSYGDRRRLEIARALALEPQFLLLDEPAAGMNPTETQELTALLRDIVDQIGCGIIIVEHDLPMVMKLCDRIVVLNKGDQIASGTPAEVAKNPVVIEAYIGDEGVV
ncbi:MAG: ABC transporter permease subunit [Thiolinea sp.]